VSNLYINHSSKKFILPVCKLKKKKYIQNPHGFTVIMDFISLKFNQKLVSIKDKYICYYKKLNFCYYIILYTCFTSR